MIRFPFIKDWRHFRFRRPRWEFHTLAELLSSQMFRIPMALVNILSFFF